MKHNNLYPRPIYDTEPNPNQLLYEWKPGQSQYSTVRLSFVYVIQKIWYESRDGSLRCFVTMIGDCGERTFQYFVPDKDLQILINYGTTNPEMTAKILGMEKNWAYELLLYINRFLRSFA